MIKFYVIRERKTGKFLGGSSYSGRRFVDNLKDAKFWTRSSSASLACNAAPGVLQFFRNKNYQWNGNQAAWWSRRDPDFPIEVVEFNALLVDAKKGYIG